MTFPGNLAGLLPERATRHPERFALVEHRRGRARRLTFAHLADRVETYAGHLHSRGVRPGDRVLLFVPMSAQLYITLLGVLHAGATAVFLDAWADRQRLDAAVDALRPRAFVGSPRAHLLRLLSASIRRIPIHLSAGAPPRERPLPLQPVDPNEPALVTLTTGSTGRPKAAGRSHAFLWAQHRAVSNHLLLRETDIDMPALPIFVLGNLAQGVPSVLPDFDPRCPAKVRPERIDRQLREEGVTTSGGSPAFFERLAHWSSSRGRELPLRALFTGGAPVMPNLARVLVETVAGEARLVYGSTEAEPISGIALPEMLARTSKGPGLPVGEPVPEIEVRLEAGEIMVSGPHVLTGYLDNPEAERETKVREGGKVWHRTGDGGILDPDGSLRLLGRTSLAVRRGGDTWWPLPVEIAASEADGVRHAAYFPSRGRAVLVVEATRPPFSSPANAAKTVEAPVDECVTLPMIPRDPRHASKTDLAALRRKLGLPP